MNLALSVYGASSYNTLPTMCGAVLSPNAKRQEPELCAVQLGDHTNHSVGSMSHLRIESSACMLMMRLRWQMIVLCDRRARTCEAHQELRQRRWL